MRNHVFHSNLTLAARGETIDIYIVIDISMGETESRYNSFLNTTCG